MNCATCQSWWPNTNGIAGVCSRDGAPKMCNDACAEYAQIGGDAPSVAIQFAVVVPKPPTHLMLSNGQKLPLCAISDAGLTILADKMKEELLALAARQQAEYYSRPRVSLT